MGIRERALAVLGGPDRHVFLAALAANLAFAARGEYSEAGQDEAHVLHALRAVNEMLIVATKQITSSLKRKPAYPDDAFLQALADKSTAGGAQHVLRRAMAEAVKELQG